MEPITIAILTFLAVVLLGGGVLLQIAYRRALNKRLVRLAGRPVERPRAPARKLVMLLHRLGRRASLKGTSRSLSRQLAQAGLFHPATPAIYLGAKVVLLLAGLVLTVALEIILALPPAPALLMIGGGSALLFFLPNIILQLRRTTHRTGVRHHLPDAVDLLEISVSAGMGLDTAWNMVADEIRQVSPRLADEMALTNLEIHLGVPRADAMRHMSERTGADELTSLVAVLVQSERFGTSLSEVLRIFATTMRELRSQRAEEVAEKAAVKLLFPMILFIFPAILVVAAGPALMIITRVLSAE